MPSQDDIQDRRDTELIAEVLNLEHTQALFRCIKGWLEEEREEVENNPQVNDSDIKRDFRYRLGLIHAFKKVLSEPDKARELIEHVNK